LEFYRKIFGNGFASQGEGWLSDKTAMNIDFLNGFKKISSSGSDSFSFYIPIRFWAENA